jgi:hypothetical protein
MPDFCQKANPGSGVRVAIEPGAAQLQFNFVFSVCFSM